MGAMCSPAAALSAVFDREYNPSISVNFHKRVPCPKVTVLWLAFKAQTLYFRFRALVAGWLIYF